MKIKKISPDVRRRKINFHSEAKWHKRMLWRLREDSQFLRSVVQFSFLLLCLWIGAEFYLFMEWGQSAGTLPYHQRPPGAEGFLPISALISLKYWIQTGIVNTVHPSGLFIFLAIMVIGVFMKKAFCSWLCPVGTLSESLWMLGQKIFGKNLRVPRWLDYPLRSIKYLLLLFFAYSIFQMDVPTLKEFIYSPYNKVADIKMYLFFLELSSVALWIIIVLAVLSLVVKNFWCRYLCPYGALLGFLSTLSPIKVTRNTSSCVDCQLCTKACPSSITVHTATTVRSDECSSCYACVEACPVKNTLVMSARGTDKPIPSSVFGALVVGVFIAITGLALLTGHWRNGIAKEEYLKRIQNIESPLYQHNRGQVATYGPND
ncbi:MAG: 4Fe-4S binding protein [Ignavibacteriae bacterium]|nr:MAG: 4Fe-4S binding protein [Ignavibacteriota bacterium]